MYNIKNNSFEFLILFVGIAAIVIRLIHLLYNPLYYGDESALYYNITQFGYSRLLKGLNYVQAAPPGFIAVSKFVYELCKNQTQYIIDLSLRLFPFLCSVLSVFAFWKFDKLIFDNNFQKITAFIIFSMNAQNVVYSAVFKQYSLELLVSIILLIISYKIVFTDKYKWYYAVIIALSVWLSYSSVFIIFPFLIYALIRKKNILKKIVPPLLISSILLWFVSFQSIISTSYIAMKTCWEELGFGYIDFFHPARIFIRFGEFILFGATTPYKILTIFCGLLIIYSIIVFLFSNNKYKLFLISPLFCVIIASVLHMYPIVVRLVLFLLPIISIIIASYNYRFKKVFLGIMLFLTLISALYYVPNINLSVSQRNHYEQNKGYLNNAK